MPLIINEDKRFNEIKPDELFRHDETVYQKTVRGLGQPGFIDRNTWQPLRSLPPVKFSPDKWVEAVTLTP